MLRRRLRLNTQIGASSSETVIVRLQIEQRRLPLMSAARPSVRTFRSSSEMAYGGPSTNSFLRTFGRTDAGYDSGDMGPRGLALLAPLHWPSSYLRPLTTATRNWRATLMPCAVKRPSTAPSVARGSIGRGPCQNGCFEERSERPVTRARGRLNDIEERNAALQERFSPCKGRSRS